ncbi:Asator [Strongyloides ratti]|uniref:Asator n=1 Tax=Strongyloides ratti TaxID=34506 RepID=A0A090L662_STRRB|nr:Asator [Strongyloides ratti]CEF65192.1 Asator [Strongyloides ratti]
MSFPPSPFFSLHEKLPLPENVKTDGPAHLDIGRKINRFVISELLGAGACGAVYLCIEVESQAKAALKAESLNIDGNSLKLEVQALKRLYGKKHVCQLISCGKNAEFCYLIMTLLGPSLSQLFRVCGSKFSPSTVIRIAIQVLYGIKQVHECGFIHRDLKPANIAIGRKVTDYKMIHILDFGLSREYFKVVDGKLTIRSPRQNVSFRGTIKYCSPSAYNRNEQSRGDDLISLFYMCSEFLTKLPWKDMVSRHQVNVMKETCPDEMLFSGLPNLIEAFRYVKTLKYHDKPNYAKIFNIFYDFKKKNCISFADLYDWEKPNRIERLKILIHRIAPSKKDLFKKNPLEWLWNRDDYTTVFSLHHESIGQEMENYLTLEEFEKSQIEF